MKKYIAIDLEEMKRNDLKMSEWVLLECITFSSNNEFNSCFISKQKLAEHIGVSRRQVYKIIESLVDKKLLEILSNGYLKTTQKWIDISSGQSVQKMHNECEKNAHSTIKKEIKRGSPTEDEVISKGKLLGISEETCIKFYLHYEAKGWRGILDFVPLLRKWGMDEKPQQKPKKKKFVSASKLELIP